MAVTPVCSPKEHWPALSGLRQSAQIIGSSFASTLYVYSRRPSTALITVRIKVAAARGFITMLTNYSPWLPLATPSCIQSLDPKVVATPNLNLLFSVLIFGALCLHELNTSQRADLGQLKAKADIVGLLLVPSHQLAESAGCPRHSISTSGWGAYAVFLVYKLDSWSSRTTLARLSRLSQS
ncbi:hypothetical protein Tco_0513346 [Tanacetum coccineum]